MILFLLFVLLISVRTNCVKNIQILDAGSMEIESKYLVSFLLGYFLGSIPTAFILVKAFKNIDIRREGSGNVGALNAYEVTGSVLIGIAVLVTDILKGFLAVKICQTLFKNEPVALLISGLSAVFGHNFSVWINFNGGRGLATSVGVLMVVNPFIILIWCLIWLLFFAKFRNVHVGNVSATLLTPLVLILGIDFFNSFSFLGMSRNLFFLFVLLLSLLIFVKHIRPLIQLVKSGEV